MRKMQRSLMQYVLLMLPMLVITACTNAVPRSIQFAPGDPNALVVFELRSTSNPSLSVTIARYDRDTQQLVANSFVGQYFIEHQGLEPVYHVMRVRPGTYVLKDVNIQAYPSSTQVCLSLGTVAFDVAAGEQVYLGSLLFDGSTLGQLKPDIAAAKVAMQRYPNVRGELKPVSLTQVKFMSRKNLGIPIC